MVAVLTKSPYVVLDDVPWDYYWRTREEFDAAVRITYDSGRMEIMTPMSPGHEGKKRLIARLIEMWAIERDVPLTSLGSITLAREDLAKGAEPDECYYLQTEAPPSEGHVLDLSIHNAPDLAIEVDLASLSVNKEPIYAALGVIELWRWDKDELRIRRLRTDRSGYDDASSSGVLPDLPVQALAGHIRMGRELHQHEVLKRWRAVIEPSR